MIAAYRHENRRHGRELMARLIDSISTGVPKALVEITKLGRTLKKRAADVLAYFDRPSTSNGPTEAINGRLEHLRGSALGFRNPASRCNRVVFPDPFSPMTIVMTFGRISTSTPDKIVVPSTVQPRSSARNVAAVPALMIETPVDAAGRPAPGLRRPQ